MYRIRRRWSGSYALAAGATDADGANANITSGTVTIVDSSGTAVVTDAACVVSAGDLTYSLAASSVSELDTYEARWTATIGSDTSEYRTRFEICGDHLFEIADLRADNDMLENATKYPDDKLVSARLWAEQRIEHFEAAGVAFVPRGAREVIYASGETKLWLANPKLRQVYSLSIDGVALTADELSALKLGNMTIERTDAFDGTVRVHYEHGYVEPSEPVRRAVMLLAAEYAIGNNLGSRATSESTDVGFIRLSIAAPGGKTGIPYVDSVIVDERRAARGGSVFVG